MLSAWYFDLGIQVSTFAVAVVLLFYSAKLARRYRNGSSAGACMIVSIFRISAALSVAFSVLYVGGFLALRLGYSIPGGYFRITFLILAISAVSQIVALGELLEEKGNA